MQDAIDDILGFIEDTIHKLNPSDRQALEVKIRFWTSKANFSGKLEVMEFTQRQLDLTE